MVLELVHEHGAVSPHLLVAVDGQEGDLCEALLCVGAVADAADDAVLPQYGQGRVSVVKDQPHDVLLGHLGKLAGEYVLQGDQLRARNVRAVVDNGLEVDVRQRGGVRHWMRGRDKVMILHVLLGSTHSIASF